MKPIVITLTSQKGGVGKTSSTVSIAAVLAEMGYKILVIDGDMQQNTSLTFGKNDNDVKGRSLWEAVFEMDTLEDSYDVKKYIHSTPLDNIDILPSSVRCWKLADDMDPLENRNKRFAMVMEKIAEDASLKYDFVLFDTNPSLGLVNFNVFVASDYIIIPVECAKYSIMGVNGIIEFFKNTRKVNRNLKIAGIALMKVDLRKSVTSVAIDQLRGAFGDAVLKNFIGIDTTVEKAQWEDQTVLEYDTKSRISMQYREITKEVLNVVLEEEDPRRSKLEAYES